MPLPWVKEEPKKIPVAKVPQQKILPSKKEANDKNIVESKPPKLQAEQEQPKKVKLSKLSSKINTGGISIKKTLQEKQNGADEIIQTATTTFDLEKLMPLWLAQAEKAKQEGKKSYHASLIKNQPVLKDNFIIELEVSNKVQEETVNKEKPALLEFLKEKLNNFSIQINTKVVEQKKEVHLYTDRDKFKELIKKNPDLLYLKEKLNLDFEF